MNIKNLLVPVTLALITTIAIQHFIFNRYLGKEGSDVVVVKSGQTFVAPQSVIETQPLNRSVDFLDADIESGEPATKTEIKTSHADYYFSTQGGALQQVIFKDDRKNLLIPITFGLEKDTDISKNFLIALDKNTPLNYHLKDIQSLNDWEKISYQIASDSALIEKEFIVYKNKSQVDLHVKISPKAEPIRPRILFSAPNMVDLKYDTVSAIFNSERGAIKKEARGKLDLNKGWFLPNFFGVENRYFVNALVKDSKGFAQRAYYSLEGKEDLIAILEGPVITEPMQWSFSFYLGPKEELTMNAVDSRLAETLDYSGLLAPLARVLLAILKYLHSFLHNYGWAIIALTIIINIVLLPLTLRSARGLKQYDEFQKKLNYIQQRYKNDPDTLAREKQELITKYGMPGAGGCLIKFLQLPILFALGRVLSNSFELYGEPFLWIQDLSSRDPYFILPILLMLSMMFIAQAPDLKQRFIMIGAALIFGAFSVNLSAGICLYILVGVLLTGIQTFIQQMPRAKNQ